MIYSLYKDIINEKVFNTSNTHNLKNLKNQYLTLKHSLSNTHDLLINDIQSFNNETIKNTYKYFNVSQHVNKGMFKQLVYKNLVIENNYLKAINHFKGLENTTFFRNDIIKASYNIILNFETLRGIKGTPIFSNEELKSIKDKYSYIKFIENCLIGIDFNIKLIDSRIKIYIQDLKLINSNEKRNTILKEIETLKSDIIKSDISQQLYLKNLIKSKYCDLNLLCDDDTLINRLYKNATFIYLKNQLTLKDCDTFKAIEKTIIRNL
jgi:hypothetical protein